MQALLEGRAALVTGAAHGIGLETARLLAQQGASVTIADVDEDAARQAAEGIRADAGTAWHFAADLTLPGAADELVQSAVDQWGALDIVVNAAGYNLNSSVAEMDDSTWHRMFDIHVHAPFAILRAVAPHFRSAAEQDRAEGREIFRKVVNVASIATMGSANQANYAAAKSAVVGLTKSLAKEWADHRVNVNAVSFGSIATRLTAPRSADNTIQVGEEHLQLGLSERLMQRISDAMPYGRIGTPREAAGGILLLCLPWSDWVNGQVLVVSGGQAFGMTT